MGTEVIKSFLVGLGFGIDDASLAKFNKAIDSAALRVTALYGTINAAATGIVYGISKISEGFEDLGYEFRLVAPAINKALLLRQELLKAYSAAGINITKVIQNSIKLNLSLTKTKYAFDAIYKSVGSRFFGLITKQSDILRSKLYANMPKIQAALEKFVNFIFKAFEAVTILGARAWSILQRIYDFFVKLHKATDGWSTIILGVIAAWKLLNLSFLATPLGMILTGLVAILALYDDFKTFQEGGKSLFNWGPVIPYINMVSNALDTLLDVFSQLWEILKAVGRVFRDLFSSDDAAFKTSLGELIDLLLDFNTKVGEIMGGLGEVILKGLLSAFTKASSALGNFIFKGLPALLGTAASNVGSAAAGFLGEGNVAANMQNGIPSTLARPLGGNTQNNSNSNTNQNVNQQTSINIAPSANASASSIADWVLSGQKNVNFDMIRNMKSPTR